MTARTTDRKGKSKETKSLVNELENDLATFTLPDSLPCSELDFPLLPKRRQRANWNNIVEESNRKFQKIEEYEESKKEQKPMSPFLNTECKYLNDEVFVHLVPALEETLRKARVWAAFKTQKCFFNGIDHIAQILWTNNPRHPERKEFDIHIFNMPWVKKLLKLYPRPYYPKSWLWTEDYAATVIQKSVRQYFVQREDEVQEMRNFWKKLEFERSVPEIKVNPLLSKKFASSHHSQKH
ncbi:unnamed protein product [Parnassius mnemosyne]|uniref:IQ domain-containing protein K n=1 Tax=Parnassius mnemosyne TaxID=213953 RepID=A0AAV1KU04_9NEOP